AGIDSADLNVGASQYKFEPAGSGERPVVWSAQGNVPQASVTLNSAGTKVLDVSATGPWALFRLMDKARFEKRGGTVYATFGTGTKTVAFKVTFPTEQNPFIRGAGVWSFRCPTVL
ncbi:MAG: type VI secretion IcmF C-terminal domain-containing protein, partial [Novosphingobium sp.]